MRLLLLAVLAVPARAEDNRALGQVANSAGVVTSGPAERASAGAARGFGETTGPGAVPIKKEFKAAPRAALTAAPVQPPAASPPGPKVYAAGEKKEEKPEWDRDGTVKAGMVGMAGAAVGFLLGGPIGACAGFLAAFFVGALLWKAGKI